MTGRLIEVGISVIPEFRSEGLDDNVIQEFVIQALRSTNTKKLPVRCAMLLATADWCRRQPSLPKEVRGHLRRHLGYEVPLIGGSMAGFYCSTEPKPRIPHGLILLTICSAELWMTVGHLDVHKLANADVRKFKLREMADNLEKRAGTMIGTGANKSLFGILPGVVRAENGQRAYFDHELHEEILAAFKHKYFLVGASAADSLEPTSGFQFANDECLESGLAVALVETGLSTATMTGHGFSKAAGGLRVSVDELAGGAEKGYVVSRLDGKPAAERVRELVQSGLAKMGRPVFGLACGDDFDIVWPVEDLDGESVGMRVKRELTVGDRLYVLDSAPRQMLETAAGILESILPRAKAKIPDLAVILGFSCVGRTKYYRIEDPDWERSLEHLRENYLGIPLVWALSAGEFGIDGRRRARANNMGISVLCLTDTYSWRATTRNLQTDLHNAASRFSLSGSPRRVMEEALAGAVEAGATGGQICLVDPKLRRILGRGFGHALRPHESPQDWPKVAEMTNRAAPLSMGGDFPLYLLENSMAVLPNLRIPLDIKNMPPSSDGQEDLLTLVVRTLRAVFIRDSRVLTSHCDQKAVEAGNIRSQLAIPLAGSQGKPIATLQLSFPDDTTIDRERLAHWVSYAQKVAASLDHAQEVEERSLLEQNAKLANNLIFGPVDPKSSPYDWCREYLDAVVRLLGADGGHIRVLQRGVSGGDEYHLATAVGYVSDLLPHTRSVIREGNGTYNKRLLQEGPRFFNTHEECAVILKDVRAVENEERFGEALRRKAEAIQSLAVLPLHYRELLLGSFIIYSCRPYLFTERRQRIALTADARAGAILRVKMGDYERARLDEERNRVDIKREGLDAERKWMLDTLTTVTKGTAEARLRSLVERVCKFAQADVASLYVWYEATEMYEAAERLILHTSYKWHKNMEGEASYKKGEGWTGGIALQKEEVSVIAPQPGCADCSRKYDDQMIPPEHRAGGGASEARIGIRLTADDKLVGVVTLVYYGGEAAAAAAHDDSLRKSLKIITRFITLCVEAAKLEAAQRQMERLLNAKDKVARHLIEATSSYRSWQLVADELREGFLVEGVNLYRVYENNKLRLDWSSPPMDDPSARDVKPVEPFGALGDLVLRKKEVFITDPTDPRLGSWPDNEGVETLFAMPIVDTRGVVRGIVAYINRKKDLDYPFPFFDEIEKGAAREVTRYPIAAAVEHMVMTREFEELSSKLVTATKIGARGLFANIVTHQIMAPFSEIRAAIDWLIWHPNCTARERKDYLRFIEEQYSQAVKTIKASADRGMPGVKSEELQIVVRAALRVVEHEITSAKIKTDINTKLSVMVNVDTLLVVGALVNLLSNAAEAMKGVQERRVLTVTTGLFPDEAYALVHIHNSYPTVTAAQIARWFEPAFTTRGRHHHLGLGLTLAKKAIENSGGRLEMTPHPSGGVSATVWLPVAVNHAGPGSNGDQL